MAQALQHTSYRCLFAIWYDRKQGYLFFRENFTRQHITELLAPPHNNRADYIERKRLSSGTHLPNIEAKLSLNQPYDQPRSKSFINHRNSLQIGNTQLNNIERKRQPSSIHASNIEAEHNLNQPCDQPRSKSISEASSFSPGKFKRVPSFFLD